MNDERIMSGDYSFSTWRAINRIRRRRTRDAVYLLGCRCQELEALLREAMKDIACLDLARRLKAEAETEPHIPATQAPAAKLGAGDEALDTTAATGTVP